MSRSMGARRRNSVAGLSPILRGGWNRKKKTSQGKPTPHEGLRALGRYVYMNNGQPARRVHTLDGVQYIPQSEFIKRQQVKERARAERADKQA